MDKLSKGWIKHFVDGSLEIGPDYLTAQGKASWRNGKLNDIISVDIIENDYRYSLISKEPRIWWQGDEYHARFMPEQTVPGELKRRFIQFQLMSEDIGKYIHIVQLPGCYQIILKDNLKGAICQLDQMTYKGMWLTVHVVPGLGKPGIQIKKDKG
jgi:hypothetical protein